MAVHTMSKALGNLDVPPPPSGPPPGGGPGGNPTSNRYAEAVIAKAHEALGDRYQVGAEGPTQFDCSGLVYWAMMGAGAGSVINNVRRRAAGYAHFFAAEGHYTGKVGDAQRGDLIVFAHPGKSISHIAIALGNGLAISALVNPWGVTVHHIGRISIPAVGACLVPYPQSSTHTTAEHAPGADNAPEETASLHAGS